MKRIIFTPVSHGRKYSRTKTGAGDLAAFAKDIKKQGLLLALAVVFIVGLVIGALYAKNANLDLLKGLDTIFSSSYHIRISQPAYFTFISSLASSFLFVLAAFLLGLSVWGPVVVPFFAAYPWNWPWRFQRLFVCEFWLSRDFVSFCCNAAGDVCFYNCHFGGVPRSDSIFFALVAQRFFRKR